MATHEQIYKDQAELYEFMISKQPDLTEIINEIRPYQGLDILDLGAGTGRLSLNIAKEAKSLICTDISSSMLSVLDNKLKKLGIDCNWKLVVTDHRHLPITDNSTDLVVSGWSICYLTNTENENWEENLDKIISELTRVMRARGTIIILETMGTGTEYPKPPGFLKPYYEALQNKYGFSHRWIRTDYVFTSVEEAKQSTEFFFGTDIAKTIEDNQWSILPECAGIWWKHL